MITIESGYGGTPTLLLSDALRRTAPDLMRQGSNRTYADVSLFPRCTECPCHRAADRTGWYDLYYTHEALADDDEYTIGEPIVRRRIEYLGSLPAPPKIPAETRLAQLPEPSLEGWTSDEIAFFGGEQRALEFVAMRQRTAVREDRTAETYDWDAAAATYAETLRAIGDRKLTAEHRVHVAEVREWRALAEVANARRSLRHLRTNAGMTPVPEYDGPGRPAIGPQVSFSLPEDEIAVLDRMRERTRATRADHLREAVRLYLRTPGEVSDLPTRYGYPAAEETPTEQQ